ncbi:TfoX/Sxy family protein [Pseudactinotalea suaedae]|uniref:TfoX/Sxy family protein n=1 Tax=Pseudactinotalea suaedae TaxID=1524924 RepID=UPI001F4F87CC|nr:TfoX/Sxy family protein [Pseudactinotalea suaedae]
MSTAAASLVDRVRAALAHEADVREVRMFGGLSFMVRGAMLVAAHGDESLLVRVDPDRSDELLARPGAGRAEMGTGRDMGPGWIRVDRAGLADEDDLAFWLGAAGEHHARLAPGSA